MGLGSKLRITWACWRGGVRYRGIDVPVIDDLVPKAVIKQLIRDAYERPEIAAMEALLGAGDRILEIGTGLGIVSALAARVDPTIQIESYEANPKLLPVIAELHRRNKITSVASKNAILLPEAGGPRTFHFHRFFPQGSIRAAFEDHGSVEVPVLAFDDVVRQFRADVLICDIEGAEEELFGKVDLTPFRVIVLELHPGMVSAEAILGIMDACVASGLQQRTDLSAGDVVAFERVT